MRLIVNNELWSGYRVYEPFNNEFDQGLTCLDRNDFIDLKKYHYLLCEFVNHSSGDYLADHGFSKESVRSLKGHLEVFDPYPIDDMLLDGADFSLAKEDEDWDWAITDGELHVFKKEGGRLIDFVIENVYDDGSSNDFDELKIRIDTAENGILAPEEVTVNDFVEDTMILGFDAELTARYFFSQETALCQKEGMHDMFSEIITLVDHRDYSIASVDDLIDFIEEVINS